MTEKTVVITGASTGIGEACALSLAARGWRVFAGVRDPADGQKLIGKAANKNIHPLLLDVTKTSSVIDAAKQVRHSLGAAGLHGLVNNAGIAVAGPLEFIPLDRLREQLDVNFLGQVAVTQEFLPLLRREQGRIINISSVSGRIALPLLGPYAASKFALEAFTDSLRVELRPWNIAVISIEPGMVDTPIWDKARTANRKALDGLPPQALEFYGEMIDAVEARTQQNRGIPVRKVADTVIQALTAARPQARYLIGRGTRQFLWLNHLPTRWRDWLIGRRLK